MEPRLEFEAKVLFESNDSFECLDRVLFNCSFDLFRLFVFRLFDLDIFSGLDEDALDSSRLSFSEDEKSLDACSISSSDRLFIVPGSVWNRGNGPACWPVIVTLT